VPENGLGLYDTGTLIRVTSWRSNNGVGRIDKATLRRVRLILRWVNRLGMYN